MLGLLMAALEPHAEALLQAGLRDVTQWALRGLASWREDAPRLDDVPVHVLPVRWVYVWHGCPVCGAPAGAHRGYGEVALCLTCQEWSPATLVPLP